MARSIATIKQQIINTKNADSVLSQKLTSTSQTAIWNLWAYVTAVAINLHEQLWDIFRKDFEDKISKVAPGTAQWLASKVLEFQYDEADPQVIQLVNFIPTYSNISLSKRIIANCSVRQRDRRIDIRVAKLIGNDLGPITFEEKQALNAYLEKIKFAGTNTNIISDPSDLIQVHATVIYDPFFSQSYVEGKVFEAINNYFKNLPFDGIVYASKIMDAMQAAEGVKDVIFKNMITRTPNEDRLGIDEMEEFNDAYDTASGYIRVESDSGYSLIDTLDFQV